MMKLPTTGAAFALAALFPFALAAEASPGAPVGDVSIYDMQYTEDPSGDSPYDGQEVTITGTVTATFYHGYVVAEDVGAWHAVFVYSDRDAPEPGDEVRLTGTVSEYYGMTQVADVTEFEHLSSGNAVVPTLTTVGDASQEAYESVLIQVQYVQVAALLGYGEWAVTDGVAGLLCDDLADYLYFPELGDQLVRVTGVLAYTFGAFKLEPRGTEDIEGPPLPHYSLHGHVVTMNDDREVIFDGYVEVLGDQIVAVGPARPNGLASVSVGGLIFPGLIDAHNHARFNVLDVIPFPYLFQDRYEWREDPLYEQFQYQYYGILHHGGNNAQSLNAQKLAEVRALTSGTTTIQGVNCNGDFGVGFAHQGVVIDNAERFPARIYSKTFPLDDSPLFWAYMKTRYWDRFVIHLSEGVNSSALDEFYTWQGMGMLDHRTSIIHGVPYGDAEWAAMADAGASLIWSPVSNMRLYGTTADVPGALAAGVNVALSQDWTESGSHNLLDELRAAEQLDDELWGDVITPAQFVEFMTRNAAHAIGSDDLIGQIAPGYRANLMVIPGNPAKPYRALTRAAPGDVKLTVVDGRPMYGSQGLMKKLPLMADVERIRVDGKWKSLSIQLEAHGIPESEKTLEQMQAELEAAYEAVEPKVCEFVPVDE